jgi:hypothetical protein
MQKQVLKFTLIIFPLLAWSAFSMAQSSGFRLHTADSLFEKRQFTQSFEHYEVILSNSEYTPAMFLKMAYIQEGLGHIGRALYYLTRYHQESGDRSAIVKMNELAQKYQLEGYTTSDADLFFTWYHQAYNYISYVMIAICIFLLTIAIRQKLKKHIRPVASTSVLLLFTFLLSVHIYYGESFSTGIIADANTFIMTGPSPGSDVVERVGEGHRLEVIGQQDVWVKVRWRGEVAYIKQNGVLKVNRDV